VTRGTVAPDSASSGRSGEVRGESQCDLDGCAAPRCSVEPAGAPVATAAVRYVGNPHSTHAAQKYGCFHFSCARTNSCAFSRASAVGRPGVPS
jgi:hypothetical protein